MGIAVLISLLPTLASTIRSGIQLFNDIKPEIQAMFQRGDITAEQQAALMSEVDDILGQFKTGNLPDHWKVQPDPARHIAASQPV